MSEPIEATPENMKRHHDPNNAIESVIAWSPTTGEEYSATPGDYWDADPTKPLVDSDGEPMILVRKVTRMEPVT